MKCYTLIPRVSGYISDWVKLLPHIKALGFDTIHILPITQMGKSLSPYSSINPYIIDPMYDPNNCSEAALENFRHFVTVLKEKKIRLCVDLVLNHLAIDHPLLQDNPKWAFADEQEADNIKRAGWDDGKQWHKWDDLALLDYGSNMGLALWEYMFHYAMFWADFAAETDGLIRLDNLHSSYVPFAEYLILQIRTKYPKLKFYAELFTDEEHLLKLIDTYNCDFLLATQWENKSTEELRHYIQYVHSDKFSPRYFCPVLSHDSGSLVDEYGSLKSAIPRQVVSALMTTGDWGIVQGTEYGLEKTLKFIGRRSEVPWHKNYDDVKPLFYSHINTLNTLLDKHDIFREKGNIHLICTDHQAIISCLRYSTSDPSKHVLIFANLDTTDSHTVEADESQLQRLGCNFYSTYYDVLNLGIYTVLDKNETNSQSQSDTRYLSLSLAPTETLVLMSKE